MKECQDESNRQAKHQKPFLRHILSEAQATYELFAVSTPLTFLFGVFGTMIYLRPATIAIDCGVFPSLSLALDIAGAVDDKILSPFGLLAELMTPVRLVGVVGLGAFGFDSFGRVKSDVSFGIILVGVVSVSIVFDVAGAPSAACAASAAAAAAASRTQC